MPVHSEKNGAVVTLTLDNQPGQFQDWSLNKELLALFGKLERDRSVRAIVITGAHPRSFVTHYDVQEIVDAVRIIPDLPARFWDFAMWLVTMLARVPAGRRLVDQRFSRGLLELYDNQQVYLRMNQMDKVIIAAINGTAAAGGCEFALAADIRYMADGDFTLGLTEPVLGFNPGGGGGQRLARALGTSRAIEMLLEARHLSPREALDLGLVHRVLAPDELLAEAQAAAARLARRSRRAIWASKRAVYRAPVGRWPTGFRLDQAGMAWGAVAPSTKLAMQIILEQIEQTPDGVPSPWHDPEMLSRWQQGTVTSFDD